MARIGFTVAKYNKIDSSTGKYASVTSGVPTFEKVVDEKFTANNNSAELYGNDALVESDYSFIDGSLELTIVDDDDTLLATLFGNTVTTDTSTKGMVSQNIGDNASYFGYGHIIPKVVGGTKKWKVEFFPKIKFQTVSAEASTRGSSVEFKTVSLTAKVFAVDSALGKAVEGDWEIHQTFDTKAKAETFLDSLLTSAS